MNLRNKRVPIKEEDIGKRDYSKMSFSEDSYDTLDDEIDDVEDPQLDGTTGEMSEASTDMVDVSSDPNNVNNDGGDGGDVSEMIGMIGYLQDMGMSMSNSTYDVDMLMNRDPEFIKRVYHKVTGDMVESRKPSNFSIGFVNQAKLTESAETKDRVPLMEADKDIVNYMKKLNIR